MISIDPKQVEDRKKRLNEKDIMYKYRKHFFLKDKYKEIIDKEKQKFEEEFEEEFKFQQQCSEAEAKLRNNVELSKSELDNLIHRNYWVFNKVDRNKAHYISKLYYSMSFGSILMFFMLGSMTRTSLDFFKIKFRSFFTKYSTIGVISGLFLACNLFVIRELFRNQLRTIVKKYEKGILDPENEYLKMPKSKTFRNFNPLEKTTKDVYNI